MNRIKQFRDAQGRTQADVANESGMSRSHFAEIESGNKPANERKLKAIATALGVAPGDLLIQDDKAAAVMAELSAIVRRSDHVGRDQILSVARLVDAANQTKPEQTPKGRKAGHR